MTKTEDSTPVPPRQSKGLAPRPTPGAYFPRRYLIEFFEFLKTHEADIEVLTYADFPWGDDWDFAGSYPAERKSWLAQLASGERDPRKVYVLLQYDVDSWPERTMALLRDQSHRALPANVMVFNKRVERKRLLEKGEVHITDYDLDDEFLQSLNSEGFVVGYHTNAFEQALFDTRRALDIFDQDVRALSQRFPIAFFSAHGGAPSPDGRNNRDLPFHENWRAKLRWVHNGCSPIFDGQFSDGGHLSLNRNPQQRDLRDFVRRLKRGKRYRILLHPQYYSERPAVSARYRDTNWYDGVTDASPDMPLWKDVRLSRWPRFNFASYFFGR